MDGSVTTLKTGLSSVSGESSFHAYLRQVNAIPSLSLEEELELAKLYSECGDVSAAHRLVTSHLKLVVKIALGYRNYGLPPTELISEGNLGLMQAVKKYRYELGFRLSTYAMWWIKASIQDYILRSWSLVKIGTTAAQKKLFFSLNKVKNKIMNLHSRKLEVRDFEQIAEELGVETREVSEMNLRLSADVSLNNAIDRDGDRGEMIEFLAEPRPNAEVSMIREEDGNIKKNLLKRAMGVLSPRELEIFKERRLKDCPSTLEHLGEKYNISKERIRQIENRAFEKIREFILNSSSKECALLTSGKKNAI